MTTMFVLSSCYETSFFDDSFVPSENNGAMDTESPPGHSATPGDTSFIEENRTESDSETSDKQETSSLEEATANKQDNTETDSSTSKKQEASTPKETTPGEQDKTGTDGIASQEQETENPKETTAQKPDKTPSDEEAVTMVWIPRTGSKYHFNPACSNMKSPSKVTLESAQKIGYTACKKCC